MPQLTREQKFKIEFKALLEKYDADFCVEEISDHQGSYARCIDVEIATKYDDNGETIERGVLFELPISFDASDIKV